MRRVAVITISFLLSMLVHVEVSVAATNAEAAVGATTRADFNGDGFSDMAVAASAEGVGTHVSAGAVNVIYGSSTGLAAAGNQFWTQASPGVPTDPETGGRFGSAVAAGDFNGDGFTDLAIAAPQQDVGGIQDAGIVIVLYGSASGLTASGSQLFDQDSELMAEQAEDNDHFGTSLAAGNFGRTGEDDLAIGVGDEDVGAVADAGVVQVVFGSVTGLSQNGNQLWTAGEPGVAGDGVEEGDHFGGTFGQGSTMVAADFGKDGHADLAVSLLAEDVGAVEDAGAVIVLYGSRNGLTAAGSQFWTEDTPGVPDTSEVRDFFGSSLAAADFGKSAQADLAIGAPQESLGSKVGCGAVTVLYGSPGGLTTAGDQFWTQDSTGVQDQCEDQGATQRGDALGFSLAAADFGKSGQADLAMGAIGEDVGTAVDAGAVNVLYGTSTRLSATGNQFWSQDSTGVADTSEGSSTVDDNPDLFSFSLLATNFGKSGEADLAVGVVAEDLVGNTILDAGAVNVLYGGASGLSATGDQFWTQDSTGIKDQAEAGDELGFALATGAGSSSA